MKNRKKKQDYSSFYGIIATLHGKGTLDTTVWYVKVVRALVIGHWKMDNGNWALSIRTLDIRSV